MKDLTKIFIDLSKCSEEQQKHIFSLLPEPEKPDYYEVYNNYKYLQFIPASKFGNDRWMVDKQAFNKTELTYPEFIKLFEGGEGEKKPRVERMTDEELREALRVETAELEALQDSVGSIETEIFYRRNPDHRR